MQLSSSRLLLNPVTINDLDFVHQLHSMPEVDQYNTIGIPGSIQETKKHLETWLQQMSSEPATKNVYTIAGKEKGDLIGLLGINFGKPVYRTAELWYKLAPEFWGQGFATESVNAALDHLFAHLHLHRVEAGCATENTASVRVLEKCGFKREGQKRKILPIRGEWKDNYVYGILEDDWKAL